MTGCKNDTNGIACECDQKRNSQMHLIRKTHIIGKRIEKTKMESKLVHQYYTPEFA